MIRNLNLFSSETFNFFPVFTDIYTVEEIVDKSDYRPDSENTRAKRLTSFAPDANGGLYDYPEGFKDDSPSVSAEVIALREGRLDKADVQRIRYELQETANKDLADAKAKEALAEAERVSKARTEYLDKMTGFSESGE